MKKLKSARERPSSLPKKQSNLFAALGCSITFKTGSKESDENMSEEQKIYEWPDGGCCPICGSREYQRLEIRQKNERVKEGGWIKTIVICQCCKCSIQFGDSKKFSRNILSKKQLGGNSMDGFSSEEGKKRVALLAMPGTGPDG